MAELGVLVRGANPGQRGETSCQRGRKWVLGAPDIRADKNRKGRQQSILVRQGAASPWMYGSSATGCEGVRSFIVMCPAISIEIEAVSGVPRQVARWQGGAEGAATPPPP